MKSIKISAFSIALYMVFSANVSSQIFSKVTTGPIVTEAGNGNAASWGDYDDDGDLDLYVSQKFSSVSNTNAYGSLFQNNCNGEFTKITQIPGALTQITHSFADCYWVDYDADGDLDLYAGNSDLFQNNGDGSFIQVEKTITNLPDYTMANSGGVRDIGKGNPCWLDYDNDGLLDFYSGRKEIYHNNGNGDYDVLYIAPFKDITEFMRGDVLTSADINNDGLMDIYICSPRTNFNSNVENVLYQNTGNGTFVENDNTGLTNTLGLSYGCAWGDIDNDLDLDVWVGRSFNQGDFLYVNNGSGTFTANTTDPIATNVNFNQSGAAWADYDNDGDLDLVVPTFSKNYVYNNDGSGNFTEITTEIVSNDVVAEAYSASWADYDNDGDLDLFVVTAYGDPNDFFYTNNIYQNNAATANWVKLDLNGVQSNRDAVGARVYVKATINGVSKWQMREVSINGSGGGESGAAAGQVIHFGLGDATTIEILKIVWPASGITQVFNNVAANRFLEIEENVNSIAEKNSCTPDFPLADLGLVSGKLYVDENNNCVYDAGIDNPIPNKAMRAEPGVYYAYTDNEGNYTFQLPAGNYTIKENPTDDGFVISACQAVREFLVTSDPLNPKNGNDIFHDKSLLPCDGAIEMSINGVGIDPTDCPSGTLNITPCPGLQYQYCVTVTNNSDLPTNPNSELTFIILDDNFQFNNMADIVSIESACLPNTIPGNLMDGMEILIPNSIPPNGGFCEYCITIEVDPFAQGVINIVTDFNNSQHNLDDQFIVNGDFASGSSGFTFDNPPYTYTGVPGNSTIFVTDQAYNTWQHDGTGIGGTDFLRVDGATTPGNFWCQDVVVEQNSTYNFSAFFNNLIIPAVAGSNDPNIQVTINGDILYQTGDIPEFPDEWVGFQEQWCSDEYTVATICMSVISDLENGGNDFGVDDITFTPWVGAALVTQDLIECSCDPNDKRVSPMGCGENGNVAKDQELTYHIRFENTGFGTAYNILLKDQIDADLDLNTLQIITASHQITDVQIIPDNNLIIKFDNINLPSTLVDSLGGAKGYVIFKINPKTGLADGTEITNQTGIYFDRNEVVLTNVTKNTLYDKPTPEAAFTHKHSCSQTGYIYDFKYSGGTPDNATYFWEFEGATPATSTVQNPTGIVFSNGTGYKLVSLTVSRNGCSETVSDTIQVTNGLSANGKKIQICHNGKTLEIDNAALASHLAHGDCVGGCSTTKSLVNEEIAEVHETGAFAMYLMPNPSNESCKVTIHGLDLQKNAATVEVYNYAGQLQHRQSANEEQVLLPTNNLVNGLYFVKVSQNGQQLIQKLVIQH